MPTLCSTSNLTTARPTPGAGARRPGAVEQFENLIALLRPEADAVIRNPKFVSGFGQQLQFHPLFGLVAIAVLDGIGNQTVENVPQASGKPVDVLLLHRKVECDLPGLKEPLLPAKSLFDQRADCHGNHLVVSRVIARRVAQVAERCQQELNLLA